MDIGLKTGEEIDRLLEIRGALKIAGESLGDLKMNSIRDLDVDVWKDIEREREKAMTKMRDVMRTVSYISAFYHP